MLHLVSVLGFGDGLITLSLLERLAAPRPFQVLGTGLTRAVAALMSRPPPLVEVLPDHAAFYRARSAGAGASLRELRQLRATLARLSQPGDDIAFERDDLRTRALLPLRRRGVFMPRTGAMYADRQGLVRRLFGTAPEWPSLPAPARPVRSVLVNPCARSADRQLPRAAFEQLLQVAGRRGWSVRVVDPCGAFADCRERVALYLERPPLADAARLLRESDLYVGPDSFFVHLAYYYGVPAFAVYLAHHHEFLVPGMADAGSFTSFETARDGAAFERALLAWLEQRPAAGIPPPTASSIVLQDGSSP